MSKDPKFDQSNEDLQLGPGGARITSPSDDKTASVFVTGTFPPASNNDRADHEVRAFPAGPNSATSRDYVSALVPFALSVGTPPSDNGSGDVTPGGGAQFETVDAALQAFNNADYGSFAKIFVTEPNDTVTWALGPNPPVLNMMVVGLDPALSSVDTGVEMELEATTEPRFFAAQNVKFVAPISVLGNDATHTVTVRMENVEISPDGGTALSIGGTGNHTVVLDGCTIFGTDGQPAIIVAGGGTLSMRNCLVRGGASQPAIEIGDGGTVLATATEFVAFPASGLVVDMTDAQNAHLRLTGCTVRGRVIARGQLRMEGGYVASTGSTPPITTASSPSLDLSDVMFDSPSASAVFTGSTPSTFHIPGCRASLSDAAIPYPKEWQHDEDGNPNQGPLAAQAMQSFAITPRAGALPDQPFGSFSRAGKLLYEQGDNYWRRYMLSVSWDSNNPPTAVLEVDDGQPIALVANSLYGMKLTVVMGKQSPIALETQNIFREYNGLFFFDGISLHEVTGGDVGARDEHYAGDGDPWPSTHPYSVSNGDLVVSVTKNPDGSGRDPTSQDWAVGDLEMLVYRGPPENP